MTFKPLADRVLVKRDEQEMVHGGIILVNNNDKPQSGTVVAVGTGVHQNGKRVLPKCAEGDHILFGKWSGDDIKIEGEDYLIIRETDIIAKLG